MNNGETVNKDGSWFLILCSWEYEHDAVALEKFDKVWKYFKKLEKAKFREHIQGDDILALNLIGKRKFVIAGRATSNKPLQELSKMITWETAIKVDVFAATNVFEFENIYK